MTKGNNGRIIWQLPLLILLIIGSVIIIKQKHDAPYRKITGFVFGTIYNITYQSEEDLRADIEAELKKVDMSLSTFNIKSTISKINNNASNGTDPMFVEVFNIARKVSEDTDGAFDITVAPIVNAWGFGFKNNLPPTPHVIDSLKTFVGYRNVVLNKHSGGQVVIKKHKETMLDCGAIAKGYGSDIVARLLKRKGIENYMIEIGGEIVCAGKNPSCNNWRIGITRPDDDSLSTNSSTIANVELSGKGMATSGNYRNYYVKDGRKYAHTIDPKTGYPVQHSLLSATVIADNCATADAYATAFMVMGIEEAKKILARHDDLAACLIYTDKNGHYAIWHSESLEKHIVER